MIKILKAKKLPSPLTEDKLRLEVHLATEPDIVKIKIGGFVIFEENTYLVLSGHCVDASYHLLLKRKDNG